MSRQRTFAWWLMERILLLLDPEEREAVRGDLSESCDSAARALGSVSRLVMHRQWMLWQCPRPWLVLSLFVLPLGVLLSFTSRSHAALSAVYLWIIVNNANVSMLRTAGFWYTAMQVLPALLLPSLTLGCVAWMVGVLLPGIARRSFRMNGALFCLVLLCANAVALPRPVSALAFDSNAPVHANVFYRSVLPLLLQCLCILVPIFLGMRSGTLSRVLRKLLWACVLICAFSLLAGVSGFWLLRIWALPPVALAAFAGAGPAGYVLTRRYSQEGRQRV